MAERAAIVTGASRGIGRAIADTLADEGFALTITARKRERLEQAAEELGRAGASVQHVAANLSDEDGIRSVVSAHRERFGRLDMLVNNAGVGIGAGATEHQAKFIDMQLDVNLRSIVLFHRECIPMLKAAGSEHHNAWVVNLASMAGKLTSPWLTVYSATKAGVIAYTRAMNAELNGDGIKSVAFCPGFVDTDMASFVKEHIPAEQMLRPSDIGEAIRFLLRVSPVCVIPEIVFARPGEAV
jgi:NAD(P)-dependent dehydrogenase (short-subunit alcohol dehydrogenase family)